MCVKEWEWGEGNVWQDFMNSDLRRKLTPEKRGAAWQTSSIHTYPTAYDGMAYESDISNLSSALVSLDLGKLCSSGGGKGTGSLAGSTW